MTDLQARAEAAADADDGFYDDCGRWRPADAEWCDHCQGMGITECYCGGDQCYCENYGEMECPRCDGEGYFVPTPAFKAARAESAKLWAELHEAVRGEQPAPPKGEGE